MMAGTKYGMIDGLKDGAVDGMRRFLVNSIMRDMLQSCIISSSNTTGITLFKQRLYFTDLCVINMASAVNL